MIRALTVALLFLALGSPLSAQAVNQKPRFKRVSHDAAAVSSVFMVPPAYEQWWIDAKRCARVGEGSLNTWVIYTVSGEGFEIEGSDDVFDGYTFTDKRKIFVRLDMWLDQKLLTHEMLHAVLYDNGRPFEHHEKNAKAFSRADSVFIRCGLGVPRLTPE